MNTNMYEGKVWKENGHVANSWRNHRTGKAVRKNIGQSQEADIILQNLAVEY